MGPPIALFKSLARNVGHHEGLVFLFPASAEPVVMAWGVHPEDLSLLNNRHRLDKNPIFLHCDTSGSLELT